jgi:folate-binding protein YgfZ
MTRENELEWLTRTVAVIALDDRSIISVSGDDAGEWLQGQVTNQLEGVEAGSSLYAFVLSLKGRVLADVYVLVRDDDFWLDVPADSVDVLLERFDRYIIMEDLDLEHRKDLRVINALGPRSTEMGDASWAVDRLGVGGRQWVVTSDDLETTLDLLRAKAEELGGGAASYEAIAQAAVLQGRPRFGVDFGDWTYPQETGLNPLAVSFKKGCYIGQETVVMLENRGKAPKVLWRWALERSDAPPAKSPILFDEAPVGELTSAAVGPDGVRALGFLKRGHESDGPAGFSVAGAAARALGSVESGPGVESAKS